MVVVVCVCVCVEGGRGHIFQLRRITVTPIIQSIYRLLGVGAPSRISLHGLERPSNPSDGIPHV